MKKVLVVIFAGGGEPQSKYIHISDCDTERRLPLRVGDEVVVVDGSYMTSVDQKEMVTGIQFTEEGNHMSSMKEVLKIKAVDLRLLVCKYSHTRKEPNTIVIEDAFGKQYFCSEINIVRTKR